MTNGIMSRGRIDTFSSELRKLPAVGLRVETSSASLDAYLKKIIQHIECHKQTKIPFLGINKAGCPSAKHLVPSLLNKTKIGLITKTCPCNIQRCLKL